MPASTDGVFPASPTYRACDVESTTEPSGAGILSSAGRNSTNKSATQIEIAVTLLWGHSAPSYGVPSRLAWPLMLRPHRSCRPCRPYTVPCQGLILFPCESEQAPHGLRPPSFDSVHDRLIPGPCFVSNAEDVVDMLHHCPSFHSHGTSMLLQIFTSLHALFACPSILRPSCLTEEGASQNVKRIFEKYCAAMFV